MEGLSQSAIHDERKVLDEFYRDCQLRGMAEESRRRYKSSVMIFFGFLEKKGVQPTQINMEQSERFPRASQV